MGNPGRDPFGESVRPVLAPLALVYLLHEVGAWGANPHDNDLVPIDATWAERDRIVPEFRSVLSGGVLFILIANSVPTVSRSVDFFQRHVAEATEPVSETIMLCTYGIVIIHYNIMLIYW